MAKFKIGDVVTIDRGRLEAAIGIYVTLSEGWDDWLAPNTVRVTAVDVDSYAIDAMIGYSNVSGVLEIGYLDVSADIFIKAKRKGMR